MPLTNIKCRNLSVELQNKGRVLLSGMGNLNRDNLTLSNALNVLVDLIRIAEVVVAGNGNGAIKHENVRLLWEYANTVLYKLNDAIASRMPRITWWVFKINLAKYVPKLVDKVFIPIVVFVLNKVGGWLN